jgi:hypothetical protein
MRFCQNDTGNADAYYEPNSFHGPTQDGRFAEPPRPLDGAADRYDHRSSNNDSRKLGICFVCSMRSRNSVCSKISQRRCRACPSRLFVGSMRCFINVNRLMEKVVAELCGSSRWAMTASKVPVPLTRRRKARAFPLESSFPPGFLFEPSGNCPALCRAFYFTQEGGIKTPSEPVVGWRPPTNSRPGA